jgi:hypothetical protein
MDIVWRLGVLARVLRRWSGLLHGHMGHRAGIAVVGGVPWFIQFVRRDDARFLWWTGRAASDALVLHRRDHGFIIGRRHGPIAGATGLRPRCDSIMHGTEGGSRCDYTIETGEREQEAWRWGRKHAGCMTWTRRTCLGGSKLVGR